MANGAPDTFVLYRIIGNDLPPRHELGQSRKNLAFILENEPDLPRCEKRYVVNRIVEQAEEEAILQMLEDAGAPYLHLPFDRQHYGHTTWDIEGVPVEYAPWTKRFADLTETEQGHVLMRLYRYKNNYVMNNNGARNAALRDGRAAAKWVLPWDGNCFVTASAWKEIVKAVLDRPVLKYFIVPMARITNNQALLHADFRPEADEEPQIIFRQDAAMEFDPGHYYGHRPKVQLLWRLGVPGVWDNWSIRPWDLPCPPYGDDAGAYGQAGWAARLFSGQAHLEEEGERPAPVSGEKRSFKERGLARVTGIKGLLDRLDDECFDRSFDREQTTFIPSWQEAPCEVEQTVLMKALRNAADEALLRGPFSVVDKTTLPPSGNRNDYWHPAPYFWPHPLRLPGLPYVYRDGRRVPGTSLYEPLSEKYDRTRLQRLFDDTFVLTLAWRRYRDSRYARHAASLVRTWFLEPETAMNPHLEYAQVRWGHNGNKGSSSGIIEMKDLYFFLDAVRTLQSDEWLSRSDGTNLQDWLERYLHWLRTSPQGREERAAANNHGTYYDLQVTAIAGYLGDSRLVRETLRDSRSRVACQIDADGVQLQEMTRTNTAHYCCFNLQGWIHLARLAETCGEDLWSFEYGDGRSIRRAVEWLLRQTGQGWPYPQIDDFDEERFYPIYYAWPARDTLAINAPPPDTVKPLFFPHDGIMPFWQLGLPH